MSAKMRKSKAKRPRPLWFKPHQHVHLRERVGRAHMVVVAPPMKVLAIKVLNNDEAYVFARAEGKQGELIRHLAWECGMPVLKPRRKAVPLFRAVRKGRIQERFMGFVRKCLKDSKTLKPRIARVPMMRRVAKADLLLDWYPRHAAAIRHDPKSRAAPRVLALGKGRVRDHITIAAQIGRVPILQVHDYRKAPDVRVGRPLPWRFLYEAAKAMDFLYQQDPLRYVRQWEIERPPFGIDQ